MISQMFDEFKKFILKGNMIDLAVGVIIGGAFGKVTEAFTAFIMSVIGKVLSFLPFAPDSLVFDSWRPWGIAIGPVVTQLINLVLVGFALFLFIKAYNKFLVKEKPEAPAEPPPTPEDVKLLTEIRDLLKK